MKNRLALIILSWGLAVHLFAQQTPPTALNINFKNRGYCYAASPPLASTYGYGGWGDSDNMYVSLPDSSHHEIKRLGVWVKPEEEGLFADKFKGIALYIVNTLTDTVFFNAQDSRLVMKMQAIDKRGEWRDIEYLPSSWCGNSYHILYLPTNHYWQFTIPVYQGKFNTQLRFALAWKQSINGDEQWMYSNTFEGSVNPGQFTKLPKYSPNGLMDPYSN